MSTLKIENLSKQYGDVTALEDVTVADGSSTL